MSFLSSLNISGSALTAQKLRMRIAAQNLANADTVASAEGTPYIRKTATLSERRDYSDFSVYFDDAVNEVNSYAGVSVSEVNADGDGYILEYAPDDPNADENGYIRRPDIDTTEEMLEMMAASRAYEANVTAFNAVKQMATKALEIGR